ncbi:pyridoxal-phosphate dependent enzyme, partial [Mycobacterium tuberculosis]|nr:pyridoxal-phosphate dependent enzyme [Mycobacterium tuberculosis]
GYFEPQQFENPANPEIHELTTGPELVEQFEGRQIDAFLAGVGTGGTLSGVGKVLKKEYPNVEIVAIEPEASPVLSG